MEARQLRNHCRNCPSRRFRVGDGVPLPYGHSDVTTAPDRRGTGRLADVTTRPASGTLDEVTRHGGITN